MCEYKKCVYKNALDVKSMPQLLLEPSTIPMNILLLEAEKLGDLSPSVIVWIVIQKNDNNI